MLGVECDVGCIVRSGAAAIGRTFSGCFARRWRRASDHQQSGNDRAGPWKMPRVDSMPQDCRSKAHRFGVSVSEDLSPRRAVRRPWFAASVMSEDSDRKDEGAVYMAKVKMVICPWCGEPQPAASTCRSCHRSFDAQTRQDLLAMMGPWFVRDEGHPFSPGLAYERMVELVTAGELDRSSIVRGPTTRQMWTAARRTPGLSHLVGYCFACDAHVRADARSCPECQAAFGRYPDRNDLGLPELDRASTRWVPPPPEPQGISSFALDEDLMSPAASGAVFDAPAAPQRAEGSEERVRHASASVDPVALTLRREVARMQRRLSSQMLVLLLLSALLPISAVVAYRAGRNAERGPEAAVQPGGMPDVSPDAAGDGAGEESTDNVPNGL